MDRSAGDDVVFLAQLVQVLFHLELADAVGQHFKLGGGIVGVVVLDAADPVHLVTLGLDAEVAETGSQAILALEVGVFEYLVMEIAWVFQHRGWQQLGVDQLAAKVFHVLAAGRQGLLDLRRVGYRGIDLGD